MNADVVVIGGGPSGMAAALEASKTGADTILIERDDRLGGILNQCIHNGFGIHYFGEELTGPEYAYKFIREIKKSNIKVMLSSFVTKIKSNMVEVVSPSGAVSINAKSIVLSMGCREKTAGAIKLTGSRPSGVFTAGQVQKMVNIYGKLPCKKPIILGSGDIGLIMARRMTYEGAKPVMVLEIMKQTAGLARNITQCLEDYHIPLFTSTTIVDIVGENKVEGVIIAKVDDKLNIIDSTKKFVKCDGVILSVGLIPGNDLARGIKMNPKTNGAIVNEYHETSMKNVFACGNVLHVHDLVDFVTKESELTGRFAGLNATVGLKRGKSYIVNAGDGVRYTIPNSIYKGDEEVTILFRVNHKFVKSNIFVSCGNEVIKKKFVISANAGEMQEITLDKSLINGDITVSMGGEK